MSYEKSIGIENRRSQRLTLHIPVRVRWTPPHEPPIAEDTVTLVVNAHGALISLAMRVKPGTRVYVKNPALALDKECRIVRVQEIPHGKSEVAVEFMQPDSKFWGPQYVPAGAKEFGS